MSDVVEVFERASAYASIVMVPIFALSIVALADQIFVLVKRSVTTPMEKRRRYR